MDDLINTSKPQYKEDDNGGCALIILIIFLIWSCTKLNSIDDRLQRVEQKINQIKICR